MIFTIKLKRYKVNANIFGIIVDELPYKKKTCLIILLKINKNLKMDFYNTILPLVLAIFL